MAWWPYPELSGAVVLVVTTKNITINVTLAWTQFFHHNSPVSNSHGFRCHVLMVNSFLVIHQLTFLTLFISKLTSDMPCPVLCCVNSDNNKDGVTSPFLLDQNSFSE